jgi:hypothetical protein
MADRVVVLMICVQQNAQGGKDPDRGVFRCTKGGRGEMTKAPISLQDLRRRIYRKAKSDKAHRFWGLFGHVAKGETLAEAQQFPLMTCESQAARGVDSSVSGSPIPFPVFCRNFRATI